MESPAPDSVGGKRKRSPEDAGVRVPLAVQRDVTPAKINYLTKGKAASLKLIEGDGETFMDVLNTIDDYEGILQRQESLAANLGAKLVGPLLLKSFEKLFDGPIKIVQAHFNLEHVTWLDIVTFARTNMSDFVLNDTGHGKTCRVWMKGGQLEIPEDDYRLIMSGAPERMIPSQPNQDDEAAELGTLNILETRLGMLIKKADAVASKARQLNYHLKGRKTAITARKADAALTIEPVQGPQGPFSPQPFSAINRSPRPTNGENSKIQQDLLEQFMANGRRGSVIGHTPKSKGNRAVPVDAAFTGESDSRRMSHAPSDDGAESHHRVLMAARIEKLARGDPITPPCDRCRRLKFDCTKHLTACSACTKKHAKCSWKDVREGELEATATADNGYADGQVEKFEIGQQETSNQNNHGLLLLDHGHGILDPTEPRPTSQNDLAVLTQIAAAAGTANGL